MILIFVAFFKSIILDLVLPDKDDFQVMKWIASQGKQSQLLSA